MSVLETIELDGKKIEIETGKMARQADGAVTVKCGGSLVFVSVVGSVNMVKDLDYFPLSVHYMERAYAAGKIPGGFFKRETKPSTKEVLVSRLIDRPIRPLFPDDFKNEVQIVAMTLSSDQENTPDTLAMLGASAALNISDIPFKDVLGSVRVGRIDGEFVVNPTFEQKTQSDLDLVVSGSKDAILMVEGEARELQESEMLDAIKFAHGKIKILVDGQNGFIEKAKVEKRNYEPYTVNQDFIKQIKSEIKEDIEKILKISDKRARSKEHALFVANLKNSKNPEDFGLTEGEYNLQMKMALEEVEREILRSSIKDKAIRIDGRKLDEVRNITIETHVLPRAHGSALFTRGQTQSLGVATLGTVKDQQRHDDIEGDYTDRFMLHYNFPSYSVGETGRVGFPGRREIGHGMLGQKSLEQVLPDPEDFPYTIRLVSDIMESNGSSSMATVCSGCLSMLDAGVPLKSSVAGIAMGLIKAGDDFLVLTDIAGEEDHHGDMDFKVAGTRNGITGFQMDIKIDGLTFEIMEKALEQAKKGRFHILDKMDAVLAQPKSDVSEFAPHIISMTIDKEKIRDVIGSGGSVIRELIEKTGTAIDIDDDGVITIAGKDLAGAESAKTEIENIIAEPEVGKIYDGVVREIKDFGAIVDFLHKKSGLVHISKIANERVNDVHDYLKAGQSIKVKILDIKYDRGRMKIDLSMKDVKQG